jgi:hypothetical protein
MKKILATLVTAVVLGAGGLAVASAATPGAKTDAPTTAEGAQPKAHAGARKAAFKAAAAAIGLSPADLLKEMKGNHSIADVAEAHHVEAQTVIDAVVKTLDARIQQALTDGKIDNAQATKLTAAVAKRAPQLVNAKPKRIVRHKIRRAAVGIAADTIGVSATALRAAIVSGKSVSEVATAHNVEPAAVVHALVTAGDARIDKAVSNGRLDATRAAKLKGRLPQLAQRFVDFKRDAAHAKPAATA